MHCHLLVLFVFFFNATPTTEIYTLSLHDALPICDLGVARVLLEIKRFHFGWITVDHHRPIELLGEDGPPLSSRNRSEEHTSELQSHSDLVCRLLLEKKKKNLKYHTHDNSKCVHLV